MADAGEARYGLRKRRRTEDQESGSGLDRLLQAAETANHIVIFSGSGLSATSGMSTFSTKGGLYERAQRKFKLQDGKTLFTYSFFDRNRLDAQAFFADIYLEAARAKAAPGHRALAALQRAGRLQRHYTLNIDGLAERVGMDTWHPENNPSGCTVEMHGNVHHLVCVECGASAPITPMTARQLRARKPIPCTRCPLVTASESREDAAAVAGANGGVENEGPPALRFKVMLYEDAEGEHITPEEVMDLMEGDAKSADLILWVGISFQQSASTAYFRKVRRWLQEAGKMEHVVQAVINPSDEALWNLMTASSNQQELNVIEVLGSADEVLPALVKHVAEVDRQLQSVAAQVEKEIDAKEEERRLSLEKDIAAVAKEAEQEEAVKEEEEGAAGGRALDAVHLVESSSALTASFGEQLDPAI